MCRFGRGTTVGQFASYARPAEQENDGRLANRFPVDACARWISRIRESDRSDRLNGKGEGEMKRANSGIILPAALALSLAAIGMGARFAVPCCAVIDTDAVKGLVNVRNRFNGRMMQINSADLAKTLKVGDELDADVGMTQVVTIKGVAKTVGLQEPDAITPCCAVVSIAKDKQIANGLLSGIITNAGKPFDAVAPFHGVVIAKDLTTGVLHVLDTSVESASPINDVKAKVDPAEPVGARRTMSKIINEMKVGDPVWVSGKHGMVRGKGGMYAFQLRGAEGKDRQPWVMEPDTNAEGRFGIVRTNWHATVSATYQTIYVYLPGERDKSEYSEVFKEEHSVLEGEYDIKINGMMLTKVPVKAGHATRILLGALRSTAPFANQLNILDSKDREVNAIQGGQTIALPIGTYHLKVGTRTIKVEIKENEVTNF
jgi:hypothetical protein